MASEVWTMSRSVLAQEAAESWRATPHRNRIAIKGTGVDCVRLVSQILQEAGVIPEHRWPYYSLGHGLGGRHNFMVDIFKAALHCEEIEAPEFGAVVIFRVGQTTNHCGIVLAGHGDDLAIWHVQAQSRVRPDAIRQADLQTILRITEPGFKRAPETIVVQDFVQ